MTGDKLSGNLKVSVLENVIGSRVGREKVTVAKTTVTIGREAGEELFEGYNEKASVSRRLIKASQKVTSIDFRV